MIANHNHLTVQSTYHNSFAIIVLASLKVAEFYFKSQSYRESYQSLLKAANLKSPLALYNLGIFAENGLLTGQADIKEAMIRYNEAYQLGHFYAGQRLQTLNAYYQCLQPRLN